MDGTNNSGVTTEQILAILGAKEVEIQMLRQRVAELSRRLESSDATSTGQSLKKGK